MDNRKYRRISRAGGITVPSDVRRELDIQPGDGMELTVTQDNRIVMQPYRMRCTFCGSTGDVDRFHGKGICHGCREKLRKMGDGVE